MRAAAIAGVAVLSAAAGAGIGWKLHTPPPAPKLELDQAFKLRELQLGRFSLDRSQGPVRVVERWRTPAAPGCPPVDRERVTERGPVTTTKRAEVAQARAEEGRAALTVTPPAPALPAWSLGAGAQLLPKLALHLELGHRLVGPLWVQGWVTQPLELALPAAGVGARIDW